MSMKDRISARLIAALAPEKIEIIDESENHRGHGGWREGGDTHFRVIIRAQGFNGKSRVAMHREVNALLAPEFAAGLHALAIEAGGWPEA